MACGNTCPDLDMLSGGAAWPWPARANSFEHGGCGPRPLGRAPLVIAAGEGDFP
jgi:hypothetical protein